MIKGIEIIVAGVFPSLLDSAHTVICFSNELYLRVSSGVSETLKKPKKEMGDVDLTVISANAIVSLALSL